MITMWDGKSRSGIDEVVRPGFSSVAIHDSWALVDSMCSWQGAEQEPELFHPTLIASVAPLYVLSTFDAISHRIFVVTHGLIYYNDTHKRERR